MPFGPLCLRYEQASERMGARMQTVYLGTPSDKPQANAVYLAGNLKRTGDLARGLKQINPVGSPTWDLVICHRYRSYVAALRAGFLQQYCVAVAHEYGFFDRWQRRVEHWVKARNVQFAGIAPEIVDELAQVSPYVHLLPNVIDVDPTQNLTCDEARKLLGIELSAQPVIGVVGRLHYKKRPQIAVTTINRVRRQYPNAQLVFVGEGAERVAIEQHAQRLPSGAIKLLGHQAKVQHCYSAFDVLLHTARGEAFGMVALEAMIAGVPVVVGRGQGPEYVLGELGFYAQDDSPEAYANAISRALTTDCSGLLKKGVARAQEQFSIDALSQRLNGLGANRNSFHLPAGS